MAANSNKSKNTHNTRNQGNRTGNGSETLRMGETGEEEADMEVGWDMARTGKKVNKKRKKGKEEISESSSIASEEEGDEGNNVKREFRIILKFKGEVGVLGCNPLTLTYELKKLVGEIAFAKVLQDGALMITCRNEEQKNKAIKLKTIGKKTVMSYKIVGQESWVYGVINGIPLGVTMEELKDNLEGAKVIETVRLQMSREGRRMDSLSVRLKLEGKEIPDRIKLGYISYPIRQYIAPPLRCYNCQRYGHTALVCKAKMRCARCGGEHEFGKCGEGVGVKCCNCGGNHNVAYGGCEVRKKAVEVQQEKSKNNRTYAEAVRAVNDRYRQSGTERVEYGKISEGTGRMDEGRIPEDAMIVTKRNFVLFMVEVINCTAQTERRTEKLQIIVKAAERFLDIRGLKCEDIMKNLTESQSSQELGVG